MGLLDRLLDLLVIIINGIARFWKSLRRTLNECEMETPESPSNPSLVVSPSQIANTDPRLIAFIDVGPSNPHRTWYNYVYNTCLYYSHQTKSEYLIPFINSIELERDVSFPKISEDGPFESLIPPSYHIEGVRKLVWVGHLVRPSEPLVNPSTSSLNYDIPAPSSSSSSEMERE